MIHTSKDPDPNQQTSDTLILYTVDPTGGQDGVIDRDLVTPAGDVIEVRLRQLGVNVTVKEPVVITREPEEDDDFVS